MEKILNLARNVNWGYNTRNKELFIDSATNLYNYVQKNGANKLSYCEDSGQIQAIGKAFSYFARFLDYGYNANSVAAENAYYCLAKSMKLGNYYAAPELYNLLEERFDLLLDKLVVVRLFFFQQRNPNTPISHICGFGNPIHNPEARSDAQTILPHMRYYIITQFYDIESNKTLMPSDLIEYSQEKVSTDILGMSEKADLSSFINTGKEYFEKVYEEIEDTVLKF